MQKNSNKNSCQVSTCTAENGDVLKSVKIDLNKLFKSIWLVVAIALATITVISFVKYCGYLKGQNTAVDLYSTFVNDYYKSYDKKEKLQKMYDYLNPELKTNYVTGTDNWDVVRAADNLDSSLANALEELGVKFPDSTYTRGSYFFRYTNFFDFVMKNYYVDLNTLYIYWAIVAFLVLLANWWYSSATKKELQIDGNKIICKRGKKPVKEFLMKDIKSVELAGIRGLKLQGNGLKYKIILIKNASELKAAIVANLELLSNNTIVQQDNSADAILKFKELLEQGIISQEEFDAKKKQLLGL